MRITVLDKSKQERKPAVLQVAPETTVSNLKMMLEVEFSIPSCEQKLSKGTNSISDSPSATLKNLGIKDNDVLHLTRTGTQVANRVNMEQLTNMMAMGGDAMIRQQARALLERAKNDRNFVDALRYQQPALALALEHNSEDEVVRVVNQQLRTQQEALVAEQARISRILANPESIEAQDYMLESLRKQRIDENLATAQEHLPESFGQIVMLYVKVEVNNVPIVAMVDCGAQATIMSARCAEEANLMKSVDTRFAGVAQGVGQGKILGKIHICQMECAGLFIPASIIVLEESSLDLLLGLDLLRRHQCSVDLKAGCLRFDDSHSVQFMSEAELERHYGNSMMQSRRPGQSGIADANRKTLSAKPGAASSSPKRSVAVPVSQTAPRPPTGGSPTATPEARTPASEVENEKVKRLVELGFPDQKARITLRECRGDVEVAAARLFQDSGVLP